MVPVRLVAGVWRPILLLLKMFVGIGGGMSLSLKTCTVYCIHIMHKWIIIVVLAVGFFYAVVLAISSLRRFQFEYATWAGRSFFVFQIPRHTKHTMYEIVNIVRIIFGGLC